MRRKQALLLALSSLAIFFASQFVQAGDLRISIPRKGKLTPVQRLNREGVEAVQKRHYDKAKALFYRAYLYDPDDPFTLNNLGYISELEGDLERAQQFYSLSHKEMGDVVVDMDSSKKAQGKTVEELVSGVHDVPMQVNRANVEAVRLLSDGHAGEADSLLQQTLKLDPANPFTLNNLGVAKEMLGEPEQALTYYRAVATSHAESPVIVTLNPSSRGKPISEVAAESIKKVEAGRENEDNRIRVAQLNLRGVMALNRNNRQQAGELFRQAYALDPENAFSLNNLGYLAELQGDSETAQFFYERAASAQRSGMRVGLATRRSAEGMRLNQVAGGNNDKVQTEIVQLQEARRREPGPIQLKHRDGTPVVNPPPEPAVAPVAPLQPGPTSQPAPEVGPPQPQIPQLTPKN